MHRYKSAINFPQGTSLNRATYARMCSEVCFCRGWRMSLLSVTAQLETTVWTGSQALAPLTKKEKRAVEKTSCTTNLKNSLTSAAVTEMSPRRMTHRTRQDLEEQSVERKTEWMNGQNKRWISRRPFFFCSHCWEGRGEGCSVGCSQWPHH